MVYQNAEQERTVFEKGTSKLGIQVLESWAVIWDVGTRIRLLSERCFWEENRAPTWDCSLSQGEANTSCTLAGTSVEPHRVRFWSSETYCCDVNKVNANTYLQNYLVVTPRSFLIAFQPCLRNTENYWGRSTGATGRKLMLSASSSSLRYPSTWAASRGKEWARSAVGIQCWHSVYL